MPCWLRSHQKVWHGTVQRLVCWQLCHAYQPLQSVLRLLTHMPLNRNTLTKAWYKPAKFRTPLKINYPNADKEYSLTNSAEMSLSEMSSIVIGYHQSV